MTTVAYTFYPTPTFLSGSSVPTWTATNTRATSRSATRWSSVTSLRASGTSRLTPCQPGYQRYSTYGACVPKRIGPRNRMIIIICTSVFVFLVFLAILHCFYRRRLSGCLTSRKKAGLITPIQHTGRVPVSVPRPPPTLPAVPAPTVASDLPHSRVTYFRLPPPQSTSDEDLSRAIRISLTDARAVRAARQVRRQPEIEDPPPPYVIAPEVPPYQR